MYAEERHQAHRGLARRARPRRPSATLAERRSASRTETVRRDLALLERAGVAAPGARRRRARPSALTVDRARRRRARRHARPDEKDRIATAALDLLPRPGGRASCSTPARPPQAWPRLLPRDRQLTVVTELRARSPPASAGVPGIRAAHARRARPRHSPRPPSATRRSQALARPAGRRRFLGTNALQRRARASRTPDADEAAVKRAMVSAAQRVVVLADSSKLGREHLLRFAALERGRRPGHRRRRRPRRAAQRFAAQGVEVVVA